jgi:hypothetical protein
MDRLLTRSFACIDIKASKDLSEQLTSSEKERNPQKALEGQKK